jgi:hypothetical protein
MTIGRETRRKSSLSGACFFFRYSVETGSTGHPYWKPNRCYAGAAASWQNRGGDARARQCIQATEASSARLLLKHARARRWQRCTPMAQLSITPFMCAHAIWSPSRKVMPPSKVQFGTLRPLELTQLDFRWILTYVDQSHRSGRSRSSHQPHGRRQLLWFMTII